MKVWLRRVCSRCEGIKIVEYQGHEETCPSCFGKGYTEETIPKVTEMEILED